LGGGLRLISSEFSQCPTARWRQTPKLCLVACFLLPAPQPQSSPLSAARKRLPLHPPPRTREAKRDEASDRYQDAFDEAVSTAPQSVAGIRALLVWVRQDCEGLALQDEHVTALVGSLLASPILAMEG